MPHPATAKTIRPEQNRPATRKPRSRSGWSDERRARHAAAIRKWKPWEKSTGPKTKPGKARSSRNAVKDGDVAKAHRMMRDALRDHSRYLSDIHRYITLKKTAGKNELLKRCAYNLYRRLKRQGPMVTNRLLVAACYEKIVYDREQAAFSMSTNAPESLYKYSSPTRNTPCSNIMT